MPEALALFGGKQAVKGYFARAIAKGLAGMPYLDERSLEARVEEQLGLQAGVIREVAAGNRPDVLTAELLEELADPLDLGIPDILGTLKLTPEQRAEWDAERKERRFEVLHRSGGQGETDCVGSDDDHLKLFIVLAALDEL